MEDQLSLWRDESDSADSDESAKEEPNRVRRRRRRSTTSSATSVEIDPIRSFGEFLGQLLSDSESDPAQLGLINLSHRATVLRETYTPLFVSLLRDEGTSSLDIHLRARNSFESNSKSSQ